MADRKSRLAAGRRLARDLHSIRRKRGVDLKEVLDVTRLAEDVIEQLEETALIDHPAFNRVYLRSLYSSYAPVLGISLNDMVTALEEVLNGHYVGSLAIIYLGEKTPEDVTSATGETVEKAETDNATVEEEEEDTVTAGTGGAPTKKKEELRTGAVESPSDEASEQISPEDSETDSVIESDLSLETKPEAKPISSPGGLPPFRMVTTKFSKLGDGLRSSRESVLLPNMSGTLILAVVGIALIALVWFAFSWVLSLSDDEELESAASDSTSVGVVIMPDPIILPDTFAVEIIASLEALDPIRVTVDRDLRKPFWVEHQDTLVFRVTDRIRIEREVENTRVLVDGFLAPHEWFNDSQPVDISRLSTQAWLDSLTNSGISPQRISARK